jgi:hypothetical protein
MAMTICRPFKIRTDQTALIVAFLPSTGSTESSGCRIDSQTPERQGGIAGAEYSLSVQLDQSSQSLVIHETVSGLNAGNTVDGTFRIPIGLLEKPRFHNAAGRGDTRIKISFGLHEGKFLKNKHFKWHIKGTWSNMNARPLQMWKYEEWASKTRTVEIMLLNAPKNAYEMKGDIERALGLPVNKVPLPHSVSPPANVRSAQSLFGTKQHTPRTGIARILACPSPAIQDEKAENNLQTQKARMLENAELTRKRNEEEEARLKVERDAAIRRSLLSLPVSPSTGTSIFPFMPTLEKDTPTSVLTNAYQSITFMHPYVRHSFEELRLEDYNSGHTIGDLGVAQHIQIILAEKKRWQEEAAKSDKEASDLRTELFACKVSYLAKQIHLTDRAKLINSLQTDAKDFEVKYRASLDRNKVLQSAIKTLEERLTSGPTQSFVPLAPNSAKAVSTPQSTSRTLYVKYSGEDTMDIFNVHDRDKIICITPIWNQPCQNIFKIDFDSHEVATEVLKNVKLRVQDLYTDRDNTPEVSHFINDVTVLMDNAAIEIDATDAEAEVTQENTALRAQNWSLLTDLTVQKGILELEARNNAEGTTKLQAENEDLKQQLHTPTATSHVATTEHSSFDLLGLDFSNDTGAHIVPVVGDHTTNQPQLDWLNETFPSAAMMSSLAENQAENITTGAFKQATYMTPTHPTGAAPTPTASTPAGARPQTPDPDMILRIDDAVDAVSEEARKALKAGKGVTVQITEPEAIPDWLEQVNRRIVIDSMGVVRATE